MEIALSFRDVVLDRTPGELLAALIGCTATSLIAAGLFALLARRSGDRPLLVAVLVLTACLASMVAAAGYLERDRAREKGAAPAPGPQGAVPTGFPLASRILEIADGDRDGRIDEGEASRAAGRFVRDLDASGPLDLTRLAAEIERQRGLPGGPRDNPAAEMAGLFAGNIVTWLDADADRRVSMEELGDRLRSADADGDGRLDEYELAEMIRGHGEQGAHEGPAPGREVRRGGK